MSKRYNTLNNELNKIFGEKVVKLSIDAGFTCPNRDGTKGKRGCIFCSKEASGEFAGSRQVPIKEQVKQQKNLLSKKWDSSKYIVYFQNFTNTYAPVKKLRELYYEALELEGVVGIAIATRPDCLDEEVIDLLSEINKKTFLWVELGLQSIHEKTEIFIRRGYPLSLYDEAIEDLKRNNIKTVTHLIIGFPNESRDEIIQSVKYVAKTNTWGIKLHSLYIQKDTDLYDYYNKNPFPIMAMDEYISIVIESLELLPKSMVIHRITGDGKKDLLVEPKWSLDKLKVLTSIDKELKISDTFQGRKNYFNIGGANMEDNRPIGVIDSGVGGLTVVKELRNLFPQESIIYFGDNKNVPYGNKTKHEIYELTKKMIDFLIEKDVKLVAVACNTISTIVDEYFSDYKIPIVSIIRPIADYVVSNNIKEVGVVATVFTTQSGAYDKLIKEQDNTVDVVSEGCPALAGVIDSANFSNDEIENLIKMHMTNLLSKREIKDVILGCTHYPIVIDKFIDRCPEVNFINPAYEQVIYIDKLLTDKNQKGKHEKSTFEIYTTGSKDTYHKMLEILSIEKPDNIIEL